MMVLSERSDLILNLQETEKLNQLFNLLYNFLFTYFTREHSSDKPLPAGLCVLSNHDQIYSANRKSRCASEEASQIGSLLFHHHKNFFANEFFYSLSLFCESDLRVFLSCIYFYTCLNNKSNSEIFLK